MNSEGKGFAIVDEVGGNSLDRVNAILAGVPSGALKATYAALKRAGEQAKTQAGRFAKAEYNINKGQFMHHTTAEVTMVGDHTGVASATLSFAGHVLPLIEFRTTVTKKGIKTQVKRNGSTAILSHAFNMHAYGRDIIYERLGPSRTPLEEKYGPSTAHMMQNKEVIKQMDATIKETYDRRIEHEILRVLNGWGG